MKKVAILALLVSLMFVLDFPQRMAFAAEKGVEDRVIRIATHGGYPPFTMYDETTKEWSGFEIEIWRRIAELTGHEVQFLRHTLIAGFAEMDLGRADTAAHQISITPARQQKYDFSQPYFFTPYYLTVAESNNEIKTWKDMEGKTLGLPEGSAANEFVALRDPDNKVNKITYESSGNVLQEVSIGRLDACFFGFRTLPYRLKQNPNLKLKAVDKDNPIYTEINAYPFVRTDRGQKLLKLTDEALTQMFEDGSYAKICEKWFNENVMESKPAKQYREKQKSTK